MAQIKNTDTQLQTIVYIKPPKVFKIARLNSISVGTIDGTAVHLSVPPARTFLYRYTYTIHEVKYCGELFF